MTRPENHPAGPRTKAAIPGELPFGKLRLPSATGRHDTTGTTSRPACGASLACALDAMAATPVQAQEMEKCCGVAAGLVLSRSMPGPTWARADWPITAQDCAIVRKIVSLASEPEPGKSTG